MNDPSPKKHYRELTPGEMLGVKFFFGSFALIFVGSMVLMIVMLSSGCSEAGEVLQTFRDEVRTSKIGPMSMAQPDDAEMRRVVAASTSQTVTGYEQVGGSSDTWICIKASLATPQGSRSLNLLARQRGGKSWEFAGASLSRACRIKRGGPRFLN